MTTLIKWYQQLPSYTPVNISLIENMIDKMVENSIEKSGIRQDLIELDEVTRILGSPEFLKIYNDILTNMLKDIPGDYFAGQDFFDPYGNPTIPTTHIDKNHLAEDLDSAISSLRGLIQAAFSEDHSGIKYIANIKNPQQFLEAFANIMPQIGGGAYLDGLQNHVKNMSQRYGKLIAGDYSVLEAFNTNLQNVTGQIIWENISLKARAKALEIYFNTIQSETIKAFLNSGGKIIAKGVQRGRSLSKTGKQEVADSLVVVSFREEGDKEVLALTMADSTKLSQTAMGKQKFWIRSTASQTKTYTVGYLLNQIGKQIYWEKRLQPYLGGAEERPSDTRNWDNSRLAFYLLALYDVLAVRATTSGLYASTLTINNKIQTINSILHNVSEYYQYRSTGKSRGSIRHSKNNIFNMGGNYNNYIKKQQKISNGWTDQDEDMLQSNYQQYINSVLATKIAIGTNVLF